MNLKTFNTFRAQSSEDFVKEVIDEDVTTLLTTYVEYETTDKSFVIPIKMELTSSGDCVGEEGELKEFEAHELSNIIDDSRDSTV